MIPADKPMWYIKILHTNLIPDWLLRPILRWTTRSKIRGLERLPQQVQEEMRVSLLEKLDRSPIAEVPHLPNVQHYEVPPEFFQLVLGKRLKYSCCWWPDQGTTLDEAEEYMLALTCQRAGLEDGMSVLDLGCGWGSLSLWIAEKYPGCQITAISNSRDQVSFITRQAEERGYPNLAARRVDVNELAEAGLGEFDRVISIEMFEHMKNYRLLLAVISRLLKPGGKLFVHHFSHRLFAYEYQQQDSDSWMAQTFFTGGTMPSDDLLLNFLGDLTLIGHWRVGGLHYRKTLRAWLEKMYAAQGEVEGILAKTYGPDNVREWWVNWRLFFLACEMTWGWRGGREYLVSHYLFEKRIKTNLAS
jgi:cyclopropane-fatty-acyl-phospholipid synthase